MEAHVIHSTKLNHGRKEFFLDLKENDRGLYLKITEQVGNKRDTILVPSELLEGLRDHIEGMIQVVRQEEQARP